MSLKRGRPKVEPRDSSRKRSKTAQNGALPQTATTNGDMDQNPSVVHSDRTSVLHVYCFGEGTAGELGFGNVKGAAQATVPRLNRKLTNVVALTAGGMHGVAMDTDGKVLTWGGNDEFALGRPTPESDSDDDDDDSPGLNPREATPTLVSTFSSAPIAQVTAGDSCTFVLDQRGQVFGWGTFRNQNGPYGFTYQDDAIVKYQKEPLAIPGLERVVQISAGADFVLALDIHGKVYGWGPNGSGEVGYRLLERHHKSAEYLLPHLVALPRHVKISSIHTGLNHAFAIDRQGRVWTWGLNNYGQTGIAKGAGGNQTIIQIPQRIISIPAKLKMKEIAGGAHHSIGLAQDGTCLVWGRIDGGQTGLPLSALNSEPISSDVIFDDHDKARILRRPTQLSIPPCTAVAAGTDHNLAVTETGKVYSWGFNASAQCGQASTDDIPVARPIQAKSIAEEKIVFATAGGQFSMIASLGPNSTKA